MSTYSPNLRIELITTGTQAGTWGNTTNDNFAYVLESAISGAVSVTTASANQALTYLNGPTSTSSANQSVQAALTLNTSTGANFAVYAPPVSKLYVIKNASSYVATIYNSTSIGNTTAAGTGVAIPAGQTMTVWSDGTNFYQQNTSLASPSLTGSPTAPTASYGTNTTQLATTAFVQAALQALHPVGSIYINATNSTNPGTLLGFGTWTAFGAGRVPVGFDGTNALFDSAEETGGSYDSVTVAHTHTGTTGNQSADHVHGYSGTTGTESATHTHTQAVNQVYTATSGGGFAQTSSGYQTTIGLPSGSQTGTQSANHTHNFSGTTGGVSANHNHSFTTDSTGSSGTNANIQPYITVYMWKRTA